MEKIKEEGLEGDKKKKAKVKGKRKGEKIVGG